MTRTSLLYKGFYKKIKEKVWRGIGTRLYHERERFLANLLSRVMNELKFLVISSFSEHYLLDIGCGRGDLTLKISATLNLKAIGIDLNRRVIPRDGINFIVSDGCSLPFRSKVFILITAFSLIEHIYKDLREKFYNEVRRVLADDGLFIIQLPNRYFPIEQHSFLPFVGYLPEKLHNTFFHDYVSISSKNEVIEELTKRGFKLVRIQGYTAPFSSIFLKALSKIFPFGFLIIVKKVA
jgi:SAM-dependent methyltransferase